MKELRKQQTMKLFIEAAKQIIDTEGVTAVSARRIGEISGYSYATIYNYFTDINTLLTYVSIDYLEESYHYIIDGEELYSSNLDKIIAFSKRYYLYMVNNPSHFKMIFINDFGTVTEEMAQSLVPKVAVRLRMLLATFDENTFLVDKDMLYELITSSIHAKIMIKVFKRGVSSKEHDLVHIEQEIRRLMNQ